MVQHSEGSFAGKQAFFDRHATSWDQNHRENVARIREVVHSLGLAEGATVLEPGCGTGMVSAILLEVIGSKGALVGFDASRQMIAQARKKDLGPRVCYACADAHFIPCQDSFADAVVCFAAFPHFEDKTAALRECYRVLKPKGRLIIAHAIGRAALNLAHGIAGAEVSEDRIPDEPLMRALLSEADFCVISLEDRQDRYVVLAEKK